jgi:cytoskeletal protein RodZ
MFDFNSTLDTVIAMVVVILVLGLIVQAIQGFIKKMFKLKSKEIEKSLTELFTRVMEKPATAQANPSTNAPAPPLATPPADNAEGDAAQSGTGEIKTPQDLTTAVLNQFKDAGRYTRRGNVILESISKDDLLKILARIETKHFYSDYLAKFQKVSDQIRKLEREFRGLIPDDPAAPSLLRGVASAKVAEMRALLSPLMNDIKSILSGETVNPKIFLGDLINLRRINLDDALELLSQAQAAVAEDIKSERQAGNTVTVKALEELSAVLTRIAGIIGQLGQEVDEAFASLRAKLAYVERWYDTVMQSFEERYSRHMKNFSIYISIAVVIILNASFFSIYRSISTNDQQRDLIVKAGEKWLDQKSEERRKANEAATTTNTAATNTTAAAASGGGNGNANTNRNINTTGNTNVGNNTNTAGNLNTSSGNLNTAVTNTNNNGNMNGGAGGGGGGGGTTGSTAPTATATPSPTPKEVTLEDLKKDVEAIRGYAGTYQEFGFSPFTWQQIKFWFRSFFTFQSPVKDKEGRLLNRAGQPILKDCVPDGEEATNCDPVYRGMSFWGWMADRRSDLVNLLGWAIMVLLLSVGAPFWQDTLESLFGLKNLLRKRSDTRVVEQKSGEGQPRGQ